MIAIATLKDWLGNPDEVGVTTLLTNLEAAAVEFVQNETERYFGASTALTEYLLGEGTAHLHLNEAPTAITSVHYRDNVGDTWTEITEGDSDGFEIRAPTNAAGRARLLRKDGLVWADGVEFRVIYSFGYTAGAEPAMIRQAVMDLVALKYHGRGREGLESWSAAGVSWKQFSGDDILGVPGLGRTLARWKTRRAVLQ